jgi:hypothetical protein
MSQKVIYDSNGSVVRVLHTEDMSDPFGDFAIQTIEDVEPAIESAKVLADNHAERGDMKHVARVPVTIVEQAMREGWYNDTAAWRKWANDPDNSKFRVWKGRV